MSENKETRTIVNEMRTALNGDGKKIIVGYAAVFNTRAEIYRGMFEKIDPKAFDDVLDQDVRALFNHDSNIILGRTKAGTLKLSVDDKGLKYEITPPDTEQANGLMESIRRGDVSQSSFGFIIKEDKWEDHADGTFTRTILKVRTLKDISPVTFPAYEDTAVALRSKEAWKKNKHRSDLVAVELEILTNSI